MDSYMNRKRTYREEKLVNVESGENEVVGRERKVKGSLGFMNERF